MRLFELILVLACAAVSIRLAGAGRAAGAGWVHGMQLLLAVVLIAQLMIEGWRWQVLPAYAATLLVAVTPSVLGLSALTLFWSAAGASALLAVSVASCLVFPFVGPQSVHGPFAVGATPITVTVQRPSEIEPYELRAPPKVQLWYPTQAQGWPGLAAWLSQRLAARLHAEPPASAVADAPVAQADKKFPVLVYFDGWPEDKTQNIGLLRELVSRGFAVASVTYAGIDRPIVDYSSEEGFQHSVQLDHARARLHAQDAVAILDTLSGFAAEPGNRFAQRLDTQHAGTLGFSFGGGIAAEASRLDSRIRAAVNLDGRHWADALEHGVDKPYLYICEELIIPTEADLASSDPMVRYEARLDQVDYAQLAANLQARGGVRITIPGTSHMNFTDVPLRSPLRRFSAGGTIDARQAQQIIKTFVLEFFRRYAVPGQAPPLDSPWPHFPEARLESRPAPNR
jgi:dienelactone hydrolase